MLPPPPDMPRHAQALRAIKKLQAQHPGARRWAAEFGDRHLCMRYRVDAERQRRLTTVELVVDEAPTLSSVRVGLRIAWAEKRGTRHEVEASGGKWDARGRPMDACLRSGTQARLGRAHRRRPRVKSTCRLIDITIGASVRYWTCRELDMSTLAITLGSSTRDRLHLRGKYDEIQTRPFPCQRSSRYGLRPSSCPRVVRNLQEPPI